LRRALTVLQCGECGTLALIATDFEQLLAGSVFRGKAILNVGLEQCVVGNAAFEQIVEMMFEESGQSFGRDLVVFPPVMFRNGRLKPPQFDPVDDFCGANVHSLSQRHYGKTIAAYITNAYLPPVQGIPESLGTSFQLLCNFSDRIFGEQFSCFIEFLIVPTAVISLAFEAVLDNESPAFSLAAAGLPLKAAHKLDKFVPR
jgi:hypothetical protein